MTLTFQEELKALPNKARRQGYEAGLNGRSISQLDWEKEYLSQYNSGFKEGVAERQRLLSENGRSFRV